MTTLSPQEFNAQIVAEFRANKGIVGGRYEGKPMLILHSTGAKTNEPRINPMVYQMLGKDFVVFASNGARPNNPGWFHNLLANPDASVELGTDMVKVRARVPESAEREELWARAKIEFPGFANYETQTTRQIPVVVLERLD